MLTDAAVGSQTNGLDCFQRSPPAPLNAPESPIRTSSIGAELKEHTSCARAHGDGGMAGRLANERSCSR